MKNPFIILIGLLLGFLLIVLFSSTIINYGQYKICIQAGCSAIEDSCLCGEGRSQA